MNNQLQKKLLSFVTTAGSGGKSGFYAYEGNAPYGKERLGSAGRMIWMHAHNKRGNPFTLKGIKQRCEKLFADKGFMLYSFGDFYDDSTFKLVHKKAASVTEETTASDTSSKKPSGNMELLKSAKLKPLLVKKKPYWWSLVVKITHNRPANTPKELAYLTKFGDELENENHHTEAAFVRDYVAIMKGQNPRFVNSWKGKEIDLWAMHYW